MAVDEKSNEITAIPELLEVIMIKGAIVTIDAMGTQKEIAAQIIKHQGDYLLAVKNNQRELNEAIVDVFELSIKTKFNKKLIPAVFTDEISANHDRIESRVVKVLPAIEIANHLDITAWVGLQSIVQVDKIDHVTNKVETRFFISSISHNQAQQIGIAARAHWSIENNLHWMLDVVFKEDDSRIRNKQAAENLSWIRKMSVYLLKQDPKRLSMKNKMIHNCINPDNIRNLFGLI